ncbi:hypothetical protein [Pseudoalteromonas sp. H105]|uniref:hypothetical protein n=1 Tax=Pseudoalteromonas sp. H105 TaxID=1348393 RepID=UPI00128F7282|nr:hypothetical protein [Pseudoalteromonas sp. H105]
MSQTKASPDKGSGINVTHPLEAESKYRKMHHGYRFGLVSQQGEYITIYWCDEFSCREQRKSVSELAAMGCIKSMS